MNKTFKTVEEAIADIKDGAVIGLGGFFAAGVPRTLIQGLIKKGTKDLTICCGSAVHCLALTGNWISSLLKTRSESSSTPTVFFVQQQRDQPIPLSRRYVPEK